ncbi:MAG: HYR domain-containing protein, partial [Paludibacteraceae bacterium]|nr:HYR domain-containing protein [Paludibacteraceae bacterium]
VTDNCSYTLTAVAKHEDDQSGTNLTISDGKVHGTFKKGVTTITWTATDNAGNVSKPCEQTVTITDNVSPTISCDKVAAITLETPSTSCEVTADILLPEYSDNCATELTYTALHEGSAFNLTSVDESGKKASGTFPKGSTVITWSVSDGVNDPVTCEQTITVVDNIDPVVTCGNDTVIDLTDGSCVWDGSIGAPKYSDNCPNVTLSASADNNVTLSDITGGKVSGSFPIGTTKITWTATDAGNRTSSCTQTVTVTDKTAPSIDCTNRNVNVTADAMCLANNVVIQLPDVTENCSKPYTLTATRSDGAALTRNTNNVTGNFYAGTTTITWIAKDAAGNESSCDSKVNVTQETKDVNITHNICDINSYDNQTATAEISRVYPDYNVGLGTFEDVSAVERTYAFTLTHKVAAGCDYTGVLTVKAAKPVDLLNLSHTVCDIDKFGVSEAQAHIKSITGDVYNVENVVASVDSKEFSYMLVAVQGLCSYPNGKLTVSQYDKPFAPKLKVDNFCEGLTGKLTHEGALPDTTGTGKNEIVWTGGYPDLTATAVAKDYSYSYKYIDNNGCSVDSELTYTVHSKPVAPKLEVADFCEEAGSALPENLEGITWTKDAPDVSTAASVGVHEYEYTYSVSYDDGKTCVSVPETLRYEVHALPKFTTELVQGVTVISGATKVCRSENTELKITATVTNGTVLKGAVSYAYDGNANGILTYDCSSVDYDVEVKVFNTVSSSLACSSSVKVNVPFAENPTFSCATADNVYNLPTDACVVTVPFEAPAYTSCKLDAAKSFVLQKIDGSNVSDLANKNDWSLASMDLAPGLYKTIFTVADKCLQDKNTCEHTFEVKDAIKPVLECVSIDPVDADEKCMAAVSLTVPAVTENCSYILSATRSDKAPVTVSGNTAVTTGLFPIGSTTVTWIAVDPAGNAESCEQVVSVVDKSAPVVACTDTITQFTPDNSCEWSGNVALPAVKENCGYELTATRSDLVPVTIDDSKDYIAGTFPLGETKIIWTATDNATNSGTCEQVIKVVDNIVPELVCSDMNVLADNNCQWSGSVTLPKVTENCDYTLTAVRSDNNTVTIGSPFDFGSFPIDTTFVSWKVVDKSGNKGYCTQKVIVKDNIPPTVTCPANATVYVGEDNCVWTGLFGGSEVGKPEFGDNCKYKYDAVITAEDGSAVEFVDFDTEITLPKGLATVTWTVTDSAKLFATCTHTINVLDTISPSITCKGDVEGFADVASCLWTGDVTKPTFEDNCNVVTLTYEAKDDKGNVIALTDATDKVSGSFPIGSTTITWTVTDKSGNSKTCKQDVIIKDNIAPKVECEAEISVVADEMCMAKGVEIQLPKITENCSTPYTLTATRSDGADMVLPKVGDKTAGDFFVGTTTIVWTAADAVPNSATCITTVVVTEGERDVDATHIICDLASYDETDAKAEIERLYPDYVVTIGNVENLGDVEENGVKVPTRTYGFSLKHKEAYATCTYLGTLTVKATKPVELLKLSHTVCDTSVFDAVAATEFIASKTGTVYDVSEVKDAKEDGVKKFTYTLTGKANAADCKYEDGVLLVGEYPAITISPSIADICEGGNVEVVGLPASGIVWDGDFSVFDEAVGDHRYDYVYTDGNGCKLDSFLSYTVHA